jgi:hypothetical protein
VLRQQRVEKTLTIIETRRREPCEGSDEIDKALARREVEQPQCARDGETASPGSRDASLIIHQQKVGFRHQGQRDHVTFAGVERGEVARASLVFERMISSQGGGAAIQGANGCGRFGMRKFVAYPPGRQNFLKQIGQKRNVARQHKVMKRARIGDDMSDSPRRPRRCKSARSRSRSLAL